MYDQLITKKTSLQIKAIAVLLMVIHHLFGFPGRISAVQYSSFFKINEIPIEYYIGSFGKVCVSIFLFLSGYGLFINYYKKSITYKSIGIRILNFYKIFWIVFFVFISYGICVGKITFNPLKLFLSFLGMSCSYNGEWWYVQIYLILLLLYPLIRRLSDKLNLGENLVSTMGLFIIGMVLVKLNLRLNMILIGVGANILINQVYFMLGHIVCRFKLFEKLQYKAKMQMNNWFIFINVCCVFILYFIISQIPLVNNFLFVFLTPIFIYLLANLKISNQSLIFIGMHSMNIWLTHSFFCYYYFQKLCFLPKYSVLIFLWTVLLSILSSLVIEWIANNLNKFIRYLKEERMCNKRLNEY